MTDFPGIIKALADGGVEFIIVGGLAAAIHGSATGTSDIDVVYRRTRENLARVTATLTPLHPRLRGAPMDVPFRLDAAALKAGLNFTLTTDLGDLDLIGEITGGGSYEQLLEHSESGTVFNRLCRVVRLPKLIELKRAAARRKDLNAIAELEVLLRRHPS